MKTRLLVPLALASAALAAFVAFASTAAPQSAHEADEAKFVRLTRQLEQKPLGDTDKRMRTWLLQWAKDSPDITVRFCKVLKPVPGDGIPNSGILATQQIFGNAAYQIAHPDKRGDLVATQLAGARSALRAYEALAAQDPKARIPRMDELLRKEQGGTLEAELAPIVQAECAATGKAPANAPKLVLKARPQAR